ncbi:MAG: DUF3438 family protein [Cocleimonas sp.]
MKKLLFLSLFLTAFCSTAKVAVFNGSSIEVDLPLGRDVVVRFDEPQRVGMTPALKSIVTAKPAANFVTIKAMTEFDSEDVIFQGVVSGKVVYMHFNFVAENIPFESEVIVRTLDNTSISSSKKSNASSGDKPKVNLSPREVAQSLSRSIAQKFGAKHAIENSIFSIKELTSNYKLTPVQGLYRAPNIDVSPIKSFSGGGLIGTVFLVENNSRERLLIDPHLFRGDWVGIDLLVSDTELNPSAKTLITLLHIKALPADIAEIFPNRGR